MGSKNSFEEFLKNPYTKKFLEYYESVLCNAVNTISAVCDEMSSKKRKLKPDELSEIISCIDNQCSGLMRISECSITLRRLVENEDEENIDLMAFLNLFAKKCSSVIGQLCDFEVYGEKEIIVKVQHSVLKYSMLEFVRRYALEYGRHTCFRISSLVYNDKAVVTIKVDPPQNENLFAIKSGINLFENNFPDINEMWSEESGMKYYYQENYMRVIIPLYTGLPELGFTNKLIFE